MTFIPPLSHKYTKNLYLIQSVENVYEALQPRNENAHANGIRSKGEGCHELRVAGMSEVSELRKTLKASNGGPTPKIGEPCNSKHHSEGRFII